MTSNTKTLGVDFYSCTTIGKTKFELSARATQEDSLAVAEMKVDQMAAEVKRYLRQVFSDTSCPKGPALSPVSCQCGERSEPKKPLTMKELSQRLVEVETDNKAILNAMAELSREQDAMRNTMTVKLDECRQVVFAANTHALGAYNKYDELMCKVNAVMHNDATMREWCKNIDKQVEAAMRTASQAWNADQVLASRVNACITKMNTLVESNNEAHGVLRKANDATNVALKTTRNSVEALQYTVRDMSKDTPRRAVRVIINGQEVSK